MGPHELRRGTLYDRQVSEGNYGIAGAKYPSINYFLLFWVVGCNSKQDKPHASQAPTPPSPH